VDRLTGIRLHDPERPQPVDVERTPDGHEPGPAGDPALEPAVLLVEQVERMTAGMLERTFEVLGTVRYQVDGTGVRARVMLVRACDGSTLCLRRYQPGDQVAVTYNPDHTSEAALAIGGYGRYQIPGTVVLLLGLLAGLFLAAAIVGFVLGP
jgi:hypothetical protein